MSDLFAKGYGAELLSVLMLFACFAVFLKKGNWICMCVLIADEPKVCPIGLLFRTKTCEEGLGVCFRLFKHHILSDQ